MPDYPILNNAPIVEAIFDIQTKVAGGVSLQDLESVHQSVMERFPEKAERIVGQVTFGPKTPEPSQTQEIKGFLFKSPEQEKIFQVRLDGFTFNKLKPYETWPQFRDEAIELWKLYNSTANSQIITRIALRFINKIEIPGLHVQLEDYFATYPQISKKLPQGLADFLIRLVIPNPETGAIAILTQKLEKPTDEKHLPIIFDIDCFNPREYDINEQRIWEDFENLRTFKNQVFFESLTEKALELFK